MMLHFCMSLLIRNALHFDRRTGVQYRSAREVDRVHITPMPGPYYRSQERRTEQISVRLPRRVKDSLQRLAYYWTALEREVSGDADVEVTVGDVVVRLTDVGIDGAWEEAHAQHDDRTIQKMVDDVVASLKKSKSSN